MTSMQHNPLRLPVIREKLIARALSADDGCISAGGLAAQLGMFRQDPLTEEQTASGASAASGLVALSRLVQFARREQRLTPEAFASQLGLDLNELVDLESAGNPPEPRVLHLVSAGLKVSYEKLQILAGHRLVRDQSLESQAIRFAASSGPMDKLSKSEAEALHAFIRALHE